MWWLVGKHFAKAATGFNGEIRLACPRIHTGVDTRRAPQTKLAREEIN
jgi:hypothetical protein